jgi:hypothetical protein
MQLQQPEMAVQRLQLENVSLNKRIVPLRERVAKLEETVQHLVGRDSGARALDG